MLKKLFLPGPSRADYADAGDFLRVAAVGFVAWFHIWQQSAAAIHCLRRDCRNMRRSSFRVIRHLFLPLSIVKHGDEIVKWCGCGRGL